MLIHYLNNQDTKEFAQLIEQDKPILVDFYADWCEPCQTLLPIVDELAEQHKEDFEIVKVNVDQNQDLARQFQVRSIPALFFIKDKTVIDRVQCLQLKSFLESKIIEIKAA